MNTLTKLALGLIGQLKPLPPVGHATPLRALLSPSLSGGMPLISALSNRQSLREFAPEPLPEQVLSDLLWSAAGINRHDVDGRTAPSALNAQEVLLYVAMPQGLFLYEPKPHALRLVVASDVRRVTCNQDFVDTAPLDLVFVADCTHACAGLGVGGAGCVRPRHPGGVHERSAGGCGDRAVAPEAARRVSFPRLHLTLPSASRNSSSFAS